MVWYEVRLLRGSQVGKNLTFEIKFLHAASPKDWNEITFSHVYPDPGDYTISIGAYPAWLNIETYSSIFEKRADVSLVINNQIKIVAEAVNDLNVTISADKENPAVKEPVNFTSTVSGGQAPYTYQWDFDDNGVIDSTSANPSYSYPAEGKYTATFTVTDNQNNTATKTLVINVTEYTTLTSCPMVYDASLDNDGDNRDIYLVRDTFSNGMKKYYTRCFYYSLGTLRTLQQETVYVDGKMNGPDKHYTSSGYLEWETPYVDGIKHGVKIKYYYESAQVERETPYVNGIVQGVENEYRVTGELERITPYVDGKINGLHKSYYESGQLRGETPYVDGIIHGLAKSYYESGLVYQEFPYVNGVWHGNKKQYDLDGQLFSCMIYENGTHVGSCMP